MFTFSDYIWLPTLQQLFRDVVEGTPLNSGYILFSSDYARTTYKKVYTISGTPPNYSFIDYGFLDMDTGLWRVDLTDVGALQFELYFLPYNLVDGTIEPYFVQVFNSQDVLQYTLEAIPGNISDIAPGTMVEENFAPNGQFLLHTNLPATETTLVNRVIKDITPIAYGGWTYEIPMGSTTVDFIKFNYVGLSTFNQYPRYNMEIICQTPGSDLFKDVRLIFLDVNKFASTTQQYTFSVSTLNMGAGTVSAGVYLIKNFGTGGSPSTQTNIGTFVFGASPSVQTAVFTFGVNNAFTISNTGDDFIQLAIRFPNSIFDVTLTDAILTPNNIPNPIFPVTTESQMVYEALAGFIQIPDYNSMDLYLDLILSPEGIIYDDSNVGKVDAIICADSEVISGDQIGNSKLWMIGQTLKVSDFSVSGVPYQRLFNKLYDSTLQYPVMGTGSDFVSLDLLSPVAGNIVKLSTNMPGSVANAVDGLSPTGFTFAKIFTGIPQNWNGFISYDASGTAATLAVIDTINEDIIVPNFPLANIYPATDIVGWTASTNLTVYTLPSFVSYGISLFLAQTNAAAASQYISFKTQGEKIVYWFKVAAAGTAPVLSPAADHTYEIDIPAGFNYLDCAKILLNAINGQDIQSITTVAGSVIPAGSYFTFSTVAKNFAVWFEVDNGGTAPVLSEILIKVSISSTDTAAVVAQKMSKAINSTYFGIFDTRGLFARGYDPTQVNDTSPRFTNLSNITSDVIASYQYDTFGSHSHRYGVENASLGTTGENNPTDSLADTDNSEASGAQQTQPRNFSVRWAINI
jgi:hypothetical protein